MCANTWSWLSGTCLERWLRSPRLRDLPPGTVSTNWAPEWYSVQLEAKNDDAATVLEEEEDPDGTECEDAVMSGDAVNPLQPVVMMPAIVQDVYG